MDDEAEGDQGDDLEPARGAVWDVSKKQGQTKQEQTEKAGQLQCQITRERASNSDKGSQEER